MVSHNLTVVHLSDLHFKDGLYKRVFDKLILDFRKQIAQDEDLVFVVTGDLVTRGKIRENSANVVKFFESLVKTIPDQARVVDVQLVPGNHDGIRWKTLDRWEQEGYLLDFKEYDDLATQIYTAFSHRDLSIKPKPKYGITEIDFYKRSIVFCRLNTASFDFRSARKKLVESFPNNAARCGETRDIIDAFEKGFGDDFARQLRDVSEEYHAIVSSKTFQEPDLVFVATHHPFSLLTVNGFDTFDMALQANGFEFGDVFLGGHTHTGNHEFSSHNLQHKIMLNTGMGWQELSEEVVRYSIYRFNLDRNTCHVTIRFSSYNEDFRADAATSHNLAFTGHDGEILPLKARSVGATLCAQSVRNTYSCGVFVDAEIISDIIKTLEELRKTRLKIMAKISEYEIMARDKGETLTLWGRILAICTFKVKDTSEYWTSCMKEFIKAEHCLGDLIKVTALELSDLMRNLTLVPCMEEKRGTTAHDFDEEKIEWRVHARKYQGRNSDNITPKNDVYVSIHAFGIEGNDDVKMPQPIKWGGLISSAYNIGKGCLLNSANPGLNETLTSWSDFLTIILMDKRLRKKFSRHEYRPMLTFGISFKAESCTSIRLATKWLYLLEGLGAQQMIDECFTYFLDKFKLTKKEILREIT